MYILYITIYNLELKTGVCVYVYLNLYTYILPGTISVSMQCAVSPRFFLIPEGRSVRLRLWIQAGQEAYWLEGWTGNGENVSKCWKVRNFRLIAAVVWVSCDLSSWISSIRLLYVLWSGGVTAPQLMELLSFCRREPQIFCGLYMWAIPHHKIVG